jgi:hypothetical protein
VKDESANIKKEVRDKRDDESTNEDDDEYMLALDQVLREPWSCLTIFGTSTGWSKTKHLGKAEIARSRPFCRIFGILGFM